MAYQLQEINRRIDQDVKGFLEECDAEYNKRINAAADAIVANLKNSPIVLLSGPSGSPVNNRIFSCSGRLHCATISQ